MLNITILCVGGLKEAFWKAACEEYIKRLGAWARVTVVELEEKRLPGNPSVAQITAALDSEAEQLLKRLPAGAFVTALCVEGGHIGSEEFAALLRARMQQTGSFVFMIGGSYGLAQAVKDRAGLRLSLSSMTFPHMIARVLLLEQLYRAGSLLGGGKYHK